MHHLSKKQHLLQMNSGFEEYFANVGSLCSYCTALVHTFSNSKYLFLNFSLLPQEMFSRGSSSPVYRPPLLRFLLREGGGSVHRLDSSKKLILFSN